MTLDAAVVLADMLAAGADDLGVRLTSRDARRLAERTIELLELAGYVIDRDDR